jgi:hypothetical protein
MGSSVNQRSSPTPNWRAASAAYTAPNIPIERIAQEVWHAAKNQPGENLPLLLRAGIIATCAETVASSNSPQQALATIRRQIALSGQASIAGDVAQRAVAGFQPTGDRLTAFAERLFFEASNYLVSRDLPGFVGSSPRIPNVSAAARLKSEVCNHVAAIVRSLPCPPEAVSSAPAWGTYVDKVVNTLSGGT